MRSNVLKAVLVLYVLLVANIAIAHHEFSVVPERDSYHNTERHAERHSNSDVLHPPDRPADADISSLGRPYLTTYFGGGFGSGGDVVGSFTDNYGDTDKIRSGGGVYFEGGLLAAFDTHTMLRLTAGFETDWTGRSNGHADFSRTRFDVTLLRSFGAFELGVGLTAHAGIGYDCDINSICIGDQDYDNALGYTLEYAITSFGPYGLLDSRHESKLHPLRSARLGLRFTDIEYTPTFEQALPTDSEVLDGRSLALFVGFAM